MDTYTGFAEVYDEMMGNVPYLEWKDYLLQLLYLNGIRPDAKITEIGCGTGTMTGLLADEGFDICGIDLSTDMLNIARKKYPDIPFRQMDMRELSLEERQDVIISVADSMNYLDTVEDLGKTIKCVYDILVPGGVLIFDLKTEYFFKNVIRNRTFRGRGHGFSYVWKNIYKEDERIHIYDLSIKHKNQNGKRVVDNEVHKQYVFSGADIKQAAIYGGFKSAKVYGDMTFEKPRRNSERIYVILKK